MLTELFVFAFFLGLSYLPDLFKGKGAKFAANHPRVVAHASVLFALFGHSAIVEAVKHYFIHFVVYSGYIVHH